MIRELLFAGMNVMRLNFSHGTHQYKEKTAHTTVHPYMVDLIETLCPAGE